MEHTTNSITFAGLGQAIQLGVDIDQPTIFLGTYGIGKSAGIRQAADAMGYALVDFRAGEILPEDVGGIGVPDKHTDSESGVVQYIVHRAVPDIVSRCWAKYNETGKPIILFLDEITSAVPAVQAALFQVLLDRIAGGAEFPPKTYVTAAGNLESDRSLVEELARPLLNRAAVYKYMGPTYDEYERHMIAMDMHPIIRTFLKVNPDFICDRIDPDNEQSPTPRSWEAGSKALYSPYIAVLGRLTSLAAQLGDEAAHELEAFIDIHDKLIAPADIFNDPDNAPVPDMEDFAAAYMQVAALTAACNKLVKEPGADADTNRKHVSAVWIYSRRVGDEMAAMALASFNKKALVTLLTEHQTELTAPGNEHFMQIATQLRN